MGIIIKGMEMPKNCDECRIMTYEDTNCISVHELFCGCPIVFRAHPQHEEHRPDYCPLVELPPHGRLIKYGKWVDGNCSVCGKGKLCYGDRSFCSSPYCPWCGACMMESEE